MEWDHLVISGDLTQLALPEEFVKARMILRPLLENPERVSIVPGNHDYYVQGPNQSDNFQNYFGIFFGKNEIHTRPLNQDWHLIGWHSAMPTPWYSSSGRIQRSTLKATDEYVKGQSVDTQFVLVNHYPISFPNRRHDTKHELLNLEQVQHWLSKHPQIRLYLHGHIHYNWHHLQHYSSHSLHVVNSASSTMLGEKSPSNFHRIRLSKDQIQVEPISF
jgi:3',5'-cyclic AMP phosphodiesterase CpdA